MATKPTPAARPPGRGAGATQAPRRGGPALWLQGLACGVAVAIATPTAVTCGVLLAPSAAAWFLSGADSRLTARTMLFCGLAAAVFPLLALWNGGHTMALALGEIANPTTLATAWVAQAGGWLMTELALLLCALAEAAETAARLARLKSRRAALEADWGFEPVEAPAQDETAAG